MSSKLQLDVCYLSYGGRHLVNAYEGMVGMVYFAGNTDQCLSALRLCMV